jgi:S1-C subfamily serine protease
MLKIKGRRRHNLRITGAAKYCLRDMLTSALIVVLALPGFSAITNNPQDKNRKTTLTRLEATQIAQIVLPSVVLITVECRDGSAVSGSGFFVGERLVATNRHVVECGDGGNIKYVGKDAIFPVVARWFPPDEELDLALLKVGGAGKPALSLSDGRDVSIASKVYAAGAPKGLEGTFSDGIVSSVRQSEKLIQHTAPISPGSSGGPLVDEYGRVIGINTLIARDGQNLNFAVPVQYLKTFLGLISSGKILAEKPIDKPGKRNTVAGGAPSKPRDPISPESTRPRPTYPSKRALSSQDLAIAGKAVESLRRLRDGWSNTDLELVLDGGVLGGDWKKDRQNYELYLLEAQDAVKSALQTMRDNIFKGALSSAMDVYLDLEVIYKKFRSFDSYARVSDIYPYVKKYSLPYQTNQIRAGAVYATLLPLGRERINRLISMLGGKPESAPVNESDLELKFWRRVVRSNKPEDYEAYLAKYPDGKFEHKARAKTNEGERIKRELAEVADRIIGAFRKGDTATLNMLLDDEYSEKSNEYPYKVSNKTQTLANIRVDATTKSHRLEEIELAYMRGETVLYCLAVYEMSDQNASRYRNAFTFIKRQDQWKVISWSRYQRKSDMRSKVE